MGLTISQEKEFSRSILSNEIQSSLQQVLNAFRHDIPFLV
jgi:hypothetical protein